MSLYDFLDSIDLTLEKNSKSYNNSFVNKFIDELKSSLYQRNAVKKSNLDYRQFVNDKIRMYKKSNLKMYKIVHR